MELQELFIVAASTIGFISLSKSLITFLRWVWVMFLRPPKNLKEYGKWALISGSAEGIGRALAFEMASKGLNLVLLDRNVPKLEATSNEIREKYGAQIGIKNIFMDLAKFSGVEIAHAIEEEIKGVDVGILINNAGVAQRNAKFFHEIDDVELMESIKVNMEAATWITRAVLPTMMKKKKGAIVNIGSGSSWVVSSFPLYTIYSTSKAYLSMFSRSISVEYKQHGIDIQCQVPLYVATNSSPFLKTAPISFVTPETFSKASIRWIGYEHLCSPYWSHSVQWFTLQSLPDVLMNAFSLGYCLKLRKRSQMKQLHEKKMQQSENPL